MIQKTASEHPRSKRRDERFAIGNDRVDSILLRLDGIKSSRGLGTLVVGIASNDVGAGVSTIAGRLAVRAAEMQLGRVLLVDANLQRPRQHENFKIAGQSGLADSMENGASLDGLISPTEIPELFVLPAGTSNAINPIYPEKLTSMMHALRLDYQFILLDLPPVRNSSRSLLLTRQCDGVVLIVDAQSTTGSQAQHSMSLLKDWDVEVLGSILNRARRTLPRWLERWL